MFSHTESEAIIRMYTDMQWFRLWGRRTRLGLVTTVSLALTTTVLLAPHVPLGSAYHDFADKRTILGIPNCLDVLSNVPFIIVGAWGVFWLQRRLSNSSFVVRQERVPYLFFFAGVGLTGVGSFWYHLAPGNSRLPWDLLPIACCFMSMLAIVIIERISTSAGFWVFVPLLALGVASVVSWYYTEAQGHGDYRFYLAAQFLPPILVAMIIAFFPGRYTRTDYLAIAFFLYVLAKIFERFDNQIYSVLGVSGHSLKHLTAAVSCYWILRMLQQRRAVKGVGKDGVRLHFLDHEDQTI